MTLHAKNVAFALVAVALATVMLAPTRARADPALETETARLPAPR